MGSEHHHYLCLMGVWGAWNWGVDRPGNSHSLERVRLGWVPPRLTPALPLHCTPWTGARPNTGTSAGVTRVGPAEQAGSRLEHQALQPDSMGLHPLSFRESRVSYPGQSASASSSGQWADMVVVSCVCWRLTEHGVGVWAGSCGRVCHEHSLCLWAAHSPVTHEEGSSEWFEHNQIEPNKTVTETSIGEGLLKSVMVCLRGRMLGRF